MSKPTTPGFLPQRKQPDLAQRKRIKKKLLLALSQQDIKEAQKWLKKL